MRYGSICSGIEAAAVAWLPLGFECAFVSEIEPFPCAVLAHHYPEVPNLGDMTKITEADLERTGTIDLLVGGTPCQSFSAAGLRAGLADPRGNLALVFLRLVDRTRPRWVVWENVPGVLSSTSHDAPDPREPPDDMAEGSEWVVEDEYDADESHAFACFLAGLSELGYGVAYRVLDAQYFGLAQRRKRVFVVGYLGDWRRAAAVLLERESLSGHPAPRREAGEGTAAGPARGADGGSGTVGALTASGRGVERPGESCGQDPVIPVYAPDLARCVATRKGSSQDFESTTMVTGALRSHPFPGSDTLGPIVPIGFNARQIPESSAGLVGPLDARGDTQAIGFNARQDHDSWTERSGPLDTDGASQAVAQPYTLASRGRGDGHNLEYRNDGTANALLQPNGGRGGIGVGAVATSVAVRRLTPLECERLMGFPDAYTLIPYRGKPAQDGPRYRGLGNSIAVPALAWIGRRIASVDSIENAPK